MVLTLTTHEGVIVVGRICDMTCIAVLGDISIQLMHV